MNKLLLKKPSKNYEKQYKDMLEDWHSTKEELIPFIMKIDCTDFSKFIYILNKMESYKIRCSIFFLMTEKTEIIGVAHIRHVLDYTDGGHIGYGIRPSMRNKGYATELLRLAVLEARKIGISDIKITCNSDNISSEKVILKNNGIFYMEKEADNKKTKYFIIKK